MPKTERTLEDFVAHYGGLKQKIVEIDLDDYDMSNPVFIVVRCGRYAAVLNPMNATDHLDVDVHPFVDGRQARAGAFGMDDGFRYPMGTGTGVTSHGWPAAALVAVLIGEQGVK